MSDFKEFEEYVEFNKKRIERMILFCNRVNGANIHIKNSVAYDMLGSKKGDKYILDKFRVRELLSCILLNTINPKIDYFIDIPLKDPNEYKNFCDSISEKGELFGYEYIIRGSEKKSIMFKREEFYDITFDSEETIMLDAIRKSLDLYIINDQRNKARELEILKHEIFKRT